MNNKIKGLLLMLPMAIILVLGLLSNNEQYRLNSIFFIVIVSFMLFICGAVTVLENYKKIN